MPAARHEAVVALARAVFAAGGRIALPADAGVTLVVASVGLEYAPARPAERRADAAPPSVLVMETGTGHQRPRNLLAPLAARGVVEYRASDGHVLSVMELLQPGPSESNGSDRGRDLITSGFLETARPDGAVLLSSGRATVQDLEVLRGSGVRVMVLRGTARDPLTREELSGIADPTERLLSGRRGNRWTREGEDADQPSGPVPYAYLMQRIVFEWFGRDSR